MSYNSSPMDTEGRSWLRIAILFVICAAIYQTAFIIYNLFFHPLRNFPGPVLQRASGLPFALQTIRGTHAFDTQKLHEKYGPVVRIGPRHLTFTDERAWKDIYGHQSGGKLQVGVELPKSWPFVGTVRSIPESLFTAPYETHQRFRHELAHGFSDTSIRQQESTILRYVNLLLKRLHEKSNENDAPISIEAWYNWTTFDIVGDLVFGQAFGSLQSVEYHPWISYIFNAVRSSSTLIALGYLGLGALIPVLVAAGSSSVQEVRKYTRDMVSKRLQMKRSDDLFEGLVKHREDWDLSFAKLASNAFGLVLAGSETTATTLSGATFLLLSNPRAMEILKQEVRSRFSSIEDINVASVSKLKYMPAVLNEALRMYSPVTSGSVRVTPTGGATIAGHYVAAGTFVEVQYYSINYSKDNWADPWVFRPERFLESAKDASEHGNKLNSLQAFSYGPRNCIGRNLAYAEMRLILARIVYEFDIELADDSKDWIKTQTAHTFWDKTPLHVRLKPAQRVASC